MKALGLGFLLGCTIMLSACSSDSGSQQELEQRDGFDYSAMMKNYADNVLVPTYSKVNASTLGLISEVQNYCTAVEQVVGGAAEVPAQDQWRQAMLDWQAAELMWVGPLLDNDKALRNRIYSYATTLRANSCAIDINIAKLRNNDFDITAAGNNTVGFDALEYLLFNRDYSHSCTTSPATLDGWDELPVQERELARCEMALTVATDLAVQTGNLVKEWELDGGDFRSRMLIADNAGVFLSQLSDALFYVEKEVKDTKLGLSFALVRDCALDACPATVEMRYADVGGDMIAANLKALKDTFNGGQGLGFDDIIAGEGFTEISAEINQKIDAAIAFADELSGIAVLNEQSQAQLDSDSKAQCQAQSLDPDPEVKTYCTLHGLVKNITDQLRTDFVTIVNVDLPKRSQSDND